MIEDNKVDRHYLNTDLTLPACAYKKCYDEMTGFIHHISSTTTQLRKLSGMLTFVAEKIPASEKSKIVISHMERIESESMELPKYTEMFMEM